MPQLVASQELGNVFSRTISFSIPGYDPFVRRVSGTAAYRVTKTNSDGFLLAGRFLYDGSPVSTGDTLIKDGGRTICYKDQCSPSTDASGATINPALWGGWPDKIRAGQSWTVEIATPWELGPPGKQVVSVVAVDPATETIRLRRSGSGEGFFADDTKQISLTAKGVKTIVDVKPGRATWTGYATFRKGIVMSDALLVERSVQVTANGQTLNGTERQYILLNSIDPKTLWQE